MKKIVIEIAPDGTSKIDAQGFTGSSCSIATREVEMALSGGGLVDDKKKPDFYGTLPQSQTLQN